MFADELFCFAEGGIQRCSQATAKGFQILNIILVRGLGLNTDVSQLQSAWEPEKCKNKFHLGFYFIKRHVK